MFITELEVNNICECKHANLKFSFDAQEVPLYLVHSNQSCEVITLALQLICGLKYCSYEALHEIRNKISKAKVRITFYLLRESKDNDNNTRKDHSSDSDEPCTSQQARERFERRSKRINKSKEKDRVIISACRDFTFNPNLIVYTIDDGPSIECSVTVFQVRFFGCTDVIFPRLTNITHGEYCQGKWLDFLSTEFIDKPTEGNSLIIEFCHLFAKRKIANNDFLNELTKSVFKGRDFLNNSRITHLISIFNDIRWMFEFITCSEYTVWFLLPSEFGNLEDISKVSIENTNFDLMRTEIQMKQANAIRFDWIQAEIHVQELLLVAVQLAFGYHCQQNIIFLHSLKNLEKHQSFEYLNFSLLQTANNQQLFFERNYLHRIIFVCTRLKICCILEYCGALLAYPNKGFVIDCNWLASTKEWNIRTKDRLSTLETIKITSSNFLKHLKETLQ